MICAVLESCTLSRREVRPRRLFFHAVRITTGRDVKLFMSAGGSFFGPDIVGSMTDSYEVYNHSTGELLFSLEFSDGQGRSDGVTSNPWNEHIGDLVRLEFKASGES